MTLSSIAAAQETLELYNAKAVELHDSSFLAAMTAPGSSRFNLLPGPFRAIRESGPTAESRKALILTFRLFYRDRDCLSFREIETLYSKLPVSDDLKAEVSAVRTEVGRYLDGYTPLVVNQGQVTRRDWLDTWLVGVAAHLNSEKRARLKEWGVTDDIAPLFEHEFEVVLMHVLQAIFWIRARNLAALTELALLEHASASIERAV